MPNSIIDTLRESLNNVAKNLGIQLNTPQASTPPPVPPPATSTRMVAPTPPPSPPPTTQAQQGGNITRNDVIQILVSNGRYLESNQVDYVLRWANASGVRKDDFLDDIILGFVDGYYFPVVNRRKK